MTPEQIEELARQIVTQGLPIDWKVYLVMGLLALVGAAIGAAVAGYYSKRGEIKAIHDQIEKVEDQTRRITSVVEREKSLAWVEQKRWDLKRDFYWEILATINALSRALRELRGVFNLDNLKSEQMQDFVSRLKVCIERAQEHDAALARVLGIGRILLTESVITLLDSYQHGLQQIEKEAMALVAKNQRQRNALNATSEEQGVALAVQQAKEFSENMQRVIDTFITKHNQILPDIIRAARKDLLSLEVKP